MALLVLQGIEAMSAVRILQKIIICNFKIGQLLNLEKLQKSEKPRIIKSFTGQLKTENDRYHFVRGSLLQHLSLQSGLRRDRDLHHVLRDRCCLVLLTHCTRHPFNHS